MNKLEIVNFILDNFIVSPKIRNKDVVKVASEHGYLKILKADFPAKDSQWLAASKDLGESVGSDNYCDYVDDIDPLYCWAKIEESLSRNIPETLEIKSFQQAIALGMIVEESYE